MKNRLRIFQLLTLVFVILALWCGYKWAHESRRSLWASLVVFQCTNMQSQFLAHSDSVDRVAIQCYLDFLVGYYEDSTNKIAGSYVEWIVKREYSTTINNTLDVLRDRMKVDYGPDPHKWIEAFHREGNETNVNQAVQVTAHKLAEPQG